MGYEVIYYYKESDENGFYKDEILSKVSKIGKTTEDVSLDFLSSKIISQLARRNILIVNVDIFEYTKKKITYKETDSGIIIKNKKFSFDKGLSCVEEVNDEELERVLNDEDLMNKLTNIILQNHNHNKNQNQNVILENKVVAEKLTNLASSKRIIREEIYDPEMIVKAKVEQKGYKFTVGKKYPIYLEKSLGMGSINYLTKDDRGKEVEINSECFVVPPVGLSFENEIKQENYDEINLWKNFSVDDTMPELRR